MALIEINFDGIIGPSHNYAGLSVGNLASSHNAGAPSYPKAAALQGIEKMRANLRLGLAQGFFMPLDRPNQNWLSGLSTDMQSAEPHIRAAAFSASAMWAANAATVSPAPDTADGRCHLSAANLLTMAHRSHEWTGTLAQLKLAFADDAHFAVHGPVPAPFGDEGAANFMRLCRTHGDAGIEIFVYGKSGGPFPARQHIEASKAIARAHRLDAAKTLFVQQSEIAIAAGAFHNDVVAVANEHVLFTHEQAFEHPEQTYADIKRLLPEAEIIIVPADRVSLADAIQSYLFNAQLVTLPDGGMALILPSEAQDNARVWGWLSEMVAGNGPIRKLVPVDVRQSMANGGGPACLRLRVVADPATVDPRFIANEAKLDQIAHVVATYWPESIVPDQLGDVSLIDQVRAARMALLTTCDLTVLV
ncbi:MAG: succinylarginine dihydrolase [Sphingomonadales bacterium 35-56-22]|jgi:succinylarginine dihydrolase|uniref:N-succinylarginine dihydrolase n=1 Tax=Sphingorhabdus sp. TaxID=1902408 RepID=UPI000BC38F94|nr:N-succinylarginine dihydrolase [Sphingorhabdus sp.]OYY16166.1 MAG: succinylarginine dihydrolase [Sphingomonadales bacterium 35-56-22]OYY96807.1 MAG: succinylarginine dihydrolase [Sphingomonadales bacterium 28-56-43]OYZ61858.1 MAG: succinylarginine dihydrolase [Sphingomonadales bacterium 24-56-14]OZA84077.1 MAG: succinylarginine dihydrolase [Sphingomonadales bacterium 39-57-19]HQS11741.1 N-succinylarginine dihydrolase [Sphingorhabdus sp.]